MSESGHRSDYSDSSASDYDEDYEYEEEYSYCQYEDDHDEEYDGYSEEENNFSEDDDEHPEIVYSRLYQSKRESIKSKHKRSGEEFDLGKIRNRAMDLIVICMILCIAVFVSYYSI